MASGFCSLDMNFLKKKILELQILQKVELFEYLNMNNFQQETNRKNRDKYAIFYFVVK